jgi:hypothetical protein
MLEYSKQFQELLDYECGLDLGKLNMSSDRDKTRLDIYINKFASTSVKRFTKIWRYTLEYGPNDTESQASGIGPCKIIVSDFFELALRHSAFLKINDKIYAAWNPTECDACGPRQDGRCAYFKSKRFFDVFGKVMQTMLTFGLKINQRLSKIFTRTLKNQRVTIDREICWDTFPLAKQIHMHGPLYGDLQFDEENRLSNFSLDNVTNVFKLPNTIHVATYFPITQIDQTITLDALSDVLCDWIRQNADQSIVATEVRNGFFAPKISNIVQSMHQEEFDDILSIDSVRIDVELFKKKLKMKEGMTIDDLTDSEEIRKTLDRIDIFNDKLLDPKNNDARVAFVTCVTSSNNIQSIPDGSISVQCKTSPDILSWNRSLSVTTCATSVTLPYFENKEEFDFIVDVSMSFGKSEFEAR